MMTWKGFNDQITFVARALLIATILYAANQISSIPTIKDGLAEIKSERWTFRDHEAYAKEMAARNDNQDRDIADLKTSVKDLARPPSNYQKN